jgi:hypothetical protein
MQATWHYRNVTSRLPHCNPTNGNVTSSFLIILSKREVPRMKLWRMFTEHPDTVGETYFQHQRHAFAFGATLVAAGAACLLHGLVPALFCTTGSRAVKRLHERMVVNRNGHTDARDSGATAGAIWSGS